MAAGCGGHLASWLTQLQVCSQSLTALFSRRRGQARVPLIAPVSLEIAVAAPTEHATMPPPSTSDVGPHSSDGAVTPAGSAGSGAQPPSGENLYSTSSVTKVFFTTAHMAQLALRGQAQHTLSRMEHHKASVDPNTWPAAIALREDSVGFYLMHPDIDATRRPAGNFGPRSVRAVAVCRVTKPTSPSDTRPRRRPSL